MKSTSLLRKAMLVVLLTELICALAFSGFALAHEHAAREHALDVALKGRSDSLLGAIQDAENAEDDVEIDRTELSVPKEDVYAVYQLGGRRIGMSPGAPEELVQRTADGLRDSELDGRRYRIYQRDATRVIDRAEHPGTGLRRPVTILYAVGTDHLWKEVFEAAGYYLVLCLLLLLGTALLMIVWLRRILNPLEELAIAAASVSADSLEFQAPLSAWHVEELRPLAKALTAAMDGLRDAFGKERRFVGDASHELKTAVAVVRSTVQVLMMRSRTPAEYAEGLKQVLDDNQRVEALVGSMLTLARMESDQASAGGTADLSEVLGESLRKLQSLSATHGVRCETDLPAKVEVAITPEKLDVLGTNLLLNAMQHSPEGGCIEVSARVEGDRAYLLVQDRGEGISEGALAHVFERFYREDASRSRNTGGAGLGLAICKAIVEGAGGTIELSSSQGKGTQVKVTLRLA